MGELKPLKPRHELFVREYFKTNNSAEAYRRAYPNVEPTQVAKRNSWRLIHGTRAPQVKARIDELRARMVKKSDITIDRILGEYETALSMAKEQEKPADIVNAATAQAKLVGLLKDRIEQTNINFDNMDDPSEIIEAVAGESPELAEKLMQLFNLIPTPITPPEQPEADLGALEAPTKAVN